jgi:dsRNA-specific ribonuclease
MNPSVVDGQVIASGKGTHKHLARDAAAEQALAILMEEEEEGS